MNFIQQHISKSEALKARILEIAENKFRDALFLAMDCFKLRTDAMDSTNEIYNAPEELLYNILKCQEYIREWSIKKDP